jgi:replicative DNA helicase
MRELELNRALPHNLEAERAVLGAVLITPEVIASLPAGFGEASFYRDAHRRIYGALLALHERRVALDFVTLNDELRRTGELDTVGGPAYISMLVDGVPRAVNATYYAQIVIDHATRRRVIAYSNDLTITAYDAEEPVDDLIAKAQKGVLSVSDYASRESAQTVGELMPATADAIMKAHEGRALVVGTATGFAELDEMTAGLHRGELALLAARPSVGKTALATNIAEYAASSGFVLMFSLEMTKDALMRRMVAGLARVEGHRLRTGHLATDDWGRITEAMGVLQDKRLVIDDSSMVPVEDLWRRSRHVAMQRGPLVLIIVDYLQLLRTRSRHENRTQQVSFISSSLKALAKELDAPVLALSQLSRGVEGRKDKVPVLSDLRESGSLEQDADLVMFLHREDGKEDAANEAELIVAKQRNGPIGRVKLAFIPALTRFENMSFREERYP